MEEFLKSGTELSLVLSIFLLILSVFTLALLNVLDSKKNYSFSDFKKPGTLFFMLLIAAFSTTAVLSFLHLGAQVFLRYFDPSRAALWLFTLTGIFMLFSLIVDRPNKNGKRAALGYLALFASVVLYALSAVALITS